MLPLEQSERLVDKGQNVNSHGLALFLHLYGLIELLNGFREILLVKEKFTVVVVDIRHVLEVLHRSPESSHGGCDRSHLVLCYTQLDVRVDEGTIKVDGLLVVLSGFGKFAEDEVKLGAVVVDISVVLVVGYGELKVVRSGILVSYPFSVRNDIDYATTLLKLGDGVYQVQDAG